ncbi:MAG TPA: TIGR03617 family F420-dependent LLM class oxidoreductase [Candidatus Binatia bacterium]|jgi:probable F420-dependent oxidoreductase|nr:TIGR03617 family F420-dependent LLM class oxidoreductase [Candidatus Binatia bacterium]
MKVDAGLTAVHLTDVPKTAREIETLGYDGLFTFEGQADPFLPLVLAAEHTSRVELATGIALAFPRSPMNLAYLGHDLQVQSSGRFVLGLGSQIRTHIEKRYSAPWSHPAARMRELVLAVRAIWRCWNEGEKLDFRGRFYTHTVMTPIFVPSASPWGPPRVVLAAVQPRMTEVAGEVADGVLVHPFNSRRFLQTSLVPSLERGLAKAGRTRAQCGIAVQTLLVTGTTDEEIAQSAQMVRAQLAFYGSTPAYRPVLEAHGWGPLQEELHALTRQGRWGEMGDLVTDDMLDTLAVVGTLDEIPGKLAARYGDIADRLSLVSYAGLERTAREQWMAMLAAVKTV